MIQLDFSEFPNLQTQRLALRKLQEKDAPRLFELRTNKEIMRYIDRPPTKSIEEVYELLKKIQQDYENTDGLSWGIYLLASNQLIGQIGLWRMDKPNYRSEVGYILDPKYHGQGLMSEALDSVCRHAFFKLRFHSLLANVNPNNQASIKLLEKIGFKQEAYFRENHFFENTFLDSAIYCLLENDLKH